MNIIMGSLDTSIEETMLYLCGEEFAYTRYVDDISISIPHYGTMNILRETCENYIQRLRDSGSDYTQLYHIAEDFSKEVFNVSDSYDFKYLTKQVEEMTTIVKNSSCSEEQIYLIVGLFHTYQKNINNNQSYNLPFIRDNIIKAIGEK